MDVNPYASPQAPPEGQAPGSAGKVALSQIFSRGLGLVGQAPGLYLFAVVFGIIISLAQRGPDGQPMAVPILILLMVSLAIYPIQVAALIGVAQGEGIRLGIERRIANVPATIGISLLLWILFSIGFLFLILPGIWLTIRYQFFVFPAVQGKGLTQSMSESAACVAGRWWATSGRSILTVSPVLAVSLLLTMIDLIVGNTTSLATTTVGLVVTNMAMGLIQFLTYAHYEALVATRAEKFKSE